MRLTCLDGPCAGQAVDVDSYRPGDTHGLRTAPPFVAGVDPDPPVRGMVWQRSDTHHYQHTESGLRWVRSARTWQNSLNGHVLNDDDFRAAGGYDLPGQGGMI